MRSNDSDVAASRPLLTISQRVYAEHAIDSPIDLGNTSHNSTSSEDTDTDTQDGALSYNDCDSAVDGLGSNSSTTSLRPSIYDSVEENGRTYHKYKEGKYFFPNDELEQNRLDLQHELFCLSFQGRLYLAPIGESPQRVLDIGTGTGIWAVDFANLHPSAEVLGTDLSPMQPEFVPPNCRFEIDDVEDDWVYSRKFDFIHGRAVGSSFADPRSVFEKAFQALVPGGHLEMQDMIMPMHYAGDIPIHSALYQWNTYITEAARRAGRPWTTIPHHPQYLHDVGFERVQARSFYWPTNPWPKGEHNKTLSRYFQQSLLDGLDGMSMKLFTHFLGWSPEQVHVFLIGVRNDIKDKSIHAYAHISVTHGRKPRATT